MVYTATAGKAVNALFFYPKPYQETAFERGISDRGTVKRKRSRFMTAFYIVMTIALVLIIALWNKVSDFKDAYLQALLFLEVMNIYNGTVIDKLWVGHSKFWGTSKNPFERKRVIRVEYFVKSPHLAPASLRSLSSSSTRLPHFLFSKRFLEVPSG